MSENGTLIITVKYGATIKVGDTFITISKGRGRQLRLKLHGPKDVNIDRSIVEEVSDGQ